MAADGGSHGVHGPSSAGGHPFPKRHRLRKRWEFLAVQQTGKKFHATHFLAAAARSPDSPGRVGITVTKKIGNAVTRNRIRRLVREFVRRGGFTPPGVDVVIIAKHSAARIRGLGEVADDLARIGKRLASC